MAARPCIVSFADQEGISHSVKVHAETLYEATVLAIGAFGEHGCSPGLGSTLQIEIQPPTVTHAISVRKVHDCVNGACKSPNERVAKDRLKRLLNQASRPQCEGRHIYERPQPS